MTLWMDADVLFFSLSRRKRLHSTAQHKGILKMRSILRVSLVFGLMAVVTVAVGQDTEKKGKKKKNRQPQVITAIQKSLAKSELTDEQKQKFEKLFASAKEGLAAINKSRTELLKGTTAKLQEVRKKASADGKKGAELQAAIQKALGFSDEQFAKFTEISKKNRQLTQQLKKDVAAVLTPEQIEKTGLSAPKTRTRKKKADK
jgi:Spy/CpxP family protein refolding chaperone